ncbi:MAG: hypothetical protein WEE64_07560 [Dehalococcoidia bacterium]
MVKNAKRVAVASEGDLLRVLEDVKADGCPRIVERSGESVAAIIGIADLDAVLSVRPTDGDISAAFAEVGSWGDVDADAMKRSIYQGRRKGSRPLNRPA